MKSLMCILFVMACVFALAQPNTGLAQTELYEFGGTASRRVRVERSWPWPWEDSASEVSGDLSLTDPSFQLFGLIATPRWPYRSVRITPPGYRDDSINIATLDYNKVTDFNVWLRDLRSVSYWARVDFYSCNPCPRPFGQAELEFDLTIWGRRAARAPSNLRASPVSQNQINITWQNNTGVGARIEIERRLSGGWSGLTNVTSSATSYEDRNVSDGTQACYRVRTCNNAGACTGYSNESCATTPRCTYSISSTSTPVRPSGGTGSVGVTAAPSGCRWTASSNVSWLTILSGGSGSGSGTVSYSVAANTSSSVRAGALTISGQTFTVAQHGIGGAIYVNRFYTGAELGTQSQPFWTINPANIFAWDGAQIKIRAGSYTESLRLFKRLTLLADGGPVTIGR